MATALKKRSSSHSDKPILVPGKGRIKVVRAVTIRQPARLVYEFWREVSNLAQVVHHPITIVSTSADASHWVVSGPFGSLAWDSIVIEDRPGKMIAWRSRKGGEVDHAGSVRFEAAAGDEGTEVIVALEYDPPGGNLGAAAANFTRDSASAQVYDALHRLKALMEAGEIPTIEGQPVGGPQRNRKGEK